MKVKKEIGVEATANHAAASEKPASTRPSRRTQQGWQPTKKTYAVSAIVIAGVALTIWLIGRSTGFSLMGYVRDVFLGFLENKGPYERVIIAALVIGLGNALLIPINILLFLAAVFMPGWPSFIAGMAGSVIAAFAGYFYGRMLNVGFVKDKLGKKFDIIRSEISREGFKAVVLLCLAPIAPNTVTNILAGLCKVPLWKLAAGTLVGFLPGVAILTLLGRQMRAMLEDPGYQGAIWIVALIGVGVLSHQIGKRIKRRIEDEAARSV